MMIYKHCELLRINTAVITITITITIINNFIFLDVPTDCNSQHVSYEEIEMKQIDMLCNPAYAVPSEVIENNCTDH